MAITKLKIDELNINQPYKNRSMPYKRYFGEMPLTESQIRERILLAEDIEDIFLEFLTYMGVLLQYKQSTEPARVELERKYKALMRKHLKNDDEFISWYAAKFSLDATEATEKNIARELIELRSDKKVIEALIPLVLTGGAVASILEPKTLTDDALTEAVLTDTWYLSDDRAKFNAENESNGILNRKDLFTAIDKGYTRKQWLDMRDEKERRTHLEVGGKIIPIDAYFQVGAARMLYPHQETGHPEETVNCRCACGWLR